MTSAAPGAHDMEAPRVYDFRNLHYKGEGGVLIPLLQKFQTEDGYISRERIAEIHRKTGVPLSQIFGVATFYAQFRLHPVGRNIIKVCHGTACHVAKADAISRTLEDQLRIGDGGDHPGPRVHPGDGGLPGLLQPGPGDHDQQGHPRQPQAHRPQEGAQALPGDEGEAGP